MSATEQALRKTLHTLYSDHHGWLQGWLRGKLGCAHQAADLAQDTFVQVLSARHTAETPVEIREPRAYLTTIAKRVLFNFWRRRDLEQAYLEALTALPEANMPSAEEQALVLEALDLMDRMLGRLTPRVRQVFLLNQLHELNYREISAKLGMPVITVRRYMKQAILACCQT